MSKVLRYVGILLLALMVVPFLADLQSPLGHGKIGIAYAKDGGGGGGGGNGGGSGSGGGGGSSNSGGHDGGRGADGHLASTWS